MPFPVTCTACDASLRLSEAPPQGKRIRCPKCKEVFAIEADDADREPRTNELQNEPRPPSRPRKMLKSTAPDADDEEFEKDDEDEEYIDESSPRAWRILGLPRVMWIMLAGVVLIGGIGAYKYFGQPGHSVQLGVGKTAPDHTAVYEQMIAVVKEQTYHVRRIYSVQDAEKIRSRLRDLNNELIDCRKRMVELGRVDLSVVRNLPPQLTQLQVQLSDDMEEAGQEPGVKEILRNP